MSGKYSISVMCAQKDMLESALEFIVVHNGLIHIDIMDKDFSNFEEFDYEQIAWIRKKYTFAIMDVHIMSRHPEKYVKFCIDNRCNIKYMKQV